MPSGLAAFGGPPSDFGQQYIALVLVSIFACAS
jgi:hypothetical protein